MPKPDPDKRRLAAGLWAIVVVAVVVLTVITFTQFAFGEGHGDFHVFHDAFVAALAGEDLYTSGIGGYIYPPLFAGLFMPLGYLSFNAAGGVFAVINGALMLLCLWIASSEMVKRFGARDNAASLPAVMLVAFAVFADKLRIEVQGGQTDLLILTGMLLALRWVDRRPILAGLALGFAGNLKYHSLIMLPYLLVRGRWRALGSAIVSLVGVALSTSLVFGWERNLDYIRRALGGLGRMLGSAPTADSANVQPITWIRSVGFPSAAARLAEWAAWPGWTVFALTGALALLILAAVLLIYRRRGQALILGRWRDDPIAPRTRAMLGMEWAGLLVAAMVFSPQSNARHMVVMLPLASLAGVLMLMPRPDVRRLPVLVATVGLLLAFIMPPASDATEAAVHAWRWVGGISFVAVGLLLVSLSEGLRWSATLPSDAHASTK